LKLMQKLKSTVLIESNYSWLAISVKF